MFSLFRSSCRRRIAYNAFSYVSIKPSDSSSSGRWRARFPSTEERITRMFSAGRPDNAKNHFAKRCISGGTTFSLNDIPIANLSSVCEHSVLRATPVPRFSGHLLLPRHSGCKVGNSILSRTWGRSPRRSHPNHIATATQDTINPPAASSQQSSAR